MPKKLSFHLPQDLISLHGVIIEANACSSMQQLSSVSVFPRRRRNMATRKSGSSKPRSTSTRSRSSRSAAKPKAQKEAKGTKTTKPAAATAAKAEPAPKATEPVKKAAAAAAPAPAAKPAAEAKKPETKKEPATKAPAPKAEAPKAAAPKAEPKPAAKAAAKAEAPAAKKSEPEAKAAPAPKAAPAAKPAAEAAPKTEAPAAKKSEPEAKAAPAPKAAPAAKPVAKAAPKTEEPKAAPAAKAEPKAAAPAAKPAAPAAKPEPKPTAEEKKPAPKAEAPKEEPKAAAKAVPAARPAPAKKEEPAKKAEAPKAAPATKEESVPKAEAAPAAKPAVKEEAPAKPAAAKAEPEPKKAAEPEKAEKPAENTAKAVAKPEEPKAAPVPAAKEETAPEPAEEEPKAEEAPAPEPEPEPLPQPRRSVAFIGSECYPFVKTGGLGDVMYALPKALVKQNCDVKVILPRYACIKQEWQEKMVYKGAFQMDLCSDGRQFYVGIMEYVSPDGVVYDFIDNQDFFTNGNPYTNLVDDIPRYCYFDKAALSALLYLNWIPDVIHCHDWQAGLVPVFLRTLFSNTEIARSKTVLTIHNLRFQGKYNIPTIKYWSGLPDYVFNKDVLQENWTEANMLKGGLTYADMITTVSGTYAMEIQTPEYGEGLDAHLRYHAGKLRGIVNGIDCDIWNPATDKLLETPYDTTNVLDAKKENKKALQEELGLEVDEDKMVIGLISRLTSQKGLDLVTSILQELIDGNTQVVVLGTGEPQYEDSFRWFENSNKGTVCSNIMYDETRSHHIYAGADALLVPSRFEPCGLTQLIAMHYGTIPVVRETGGLKDTVEPYNQYTNEGNGFTFDRYEPGLLLDAINRAKTHYFTNRYCWDEMVQRDMAKDVSWSRSASQYRSLYLELTQY
jgi:starch synthase